MLGNSAEFCRIIEVACNYFKWHVHLWSCSAAEPEAPRTEVVLRSGVRDGPKPFLYLLARNCNTWSETRREEGDRKTRCSKGFVAKYLRVQKTRKESFVSWLCVSSYKNGYLTYVQPKVSTTLQLQHPTQLHKRQA